MKRLLIVNDLAYGGGVEKLLEMFIKEWSKKYRITVVTDTFDARFQSAYSQKVRYYPLLPAHRCGRFFRKVLLGFREQVLRHTKFDIAIALKEGPSMQYVSKV